MREEIHSKVRAREERERVCLVCMCVWLCKCVWWEGGSVCLSMCVCVKVALKLKESERDLVSSLREGRVAGNEAKRFQ